MVMRYSHLAPSHLAAAVERLVPVQSAGRASADAEVRRKYDDTPASPESERPVVS